MSVKQLRMARQVKRLFQALIKSYLTKMFKSIKVTNYFELFSLFVQSGACFLCHLEECTRYITNEKAALDRSCLSAK